MLAPCASQKISMAMTVVSGIFFEVSCEGSYNKMANILLERISKIGGSIFGGLKSIGEIFMDESDPFHFFHVGFM